MLQIVIGTKEDGWYQGEWPKGVWYGAPGPDGYYLPKEVPHDKQLACLAGQAGQKRALPDDVFSGFEKKWPGCGARMANLLTGAALAGELAQFEFPLDQEWVELMTYKDPWRSVHGYSMEEMLDTAEGDIVAALIEKGVPLKDIANEPVKPTSAELLAKFRKDNPPRGPTIYGDAEEYAQRIALLLDMGSYLEGTITIESSGDNIEWEINIHVFFTDISERYTGSIGIILEQAEDFVYEYLAANQAKDNHDKAVDRILAQSQEFVASFTKPK